jgi:cytochrome b6
VRQALCFSVFRPVYRQISRPVLTPVFDPLAILRTWPRLQFPGKLSVYRWFDDRLDIKAIQDDISSKYVPPHVNIFYCMGGLVFTSFIIQAATGVAMTFYYVPDVSRALLSVESLASSVTNGWIMRSMHRWTASLMVMFLVLHVFRVYLTGGFKKPREFTWLTGIVLAVITVSFGVTGYSLPFRSNWVLGNSDRNWGP